MSPKPIARLARRSAPLLAAAAIGAGTGAGVYAVTSGGDGGPATQAPTPTAIVPAQSAATRTTTATTSLTQLYKQDVPGVVDITVEATSNAPASPFGPGGQQQTRAEGSGFVIDKQGHIVTNEHVVDGANAITVHFQDGSSAKGTLVGKDETTDTAVVDVDVPASKLHPLALGNSASVQPGRAVVALGSPFGLPGSMTAGIVSAIDRTITAPNRFSISGAIQTDAAINHGNSGGPLIDVATNTVIGVNAQIESGSNVNAGVGFAIPIDTVRKVATTLIAGGTVQHAYLGVTIADAPNGAGTRIGCVVDAGPADSAGLQTGDVITAIDGVSIPNADALSANLGSRVPGAKVTLKIDRDGSTKSIQVTLGNQPANTSNNCSS